MASSSEVARDQILAVVRQARVAGASSRTPASPRRAIVPVDAQGLRLLFENKMLGNLAQFSYLDSATELPLAVNRIAAAQGIANSAEVVVEQSLLHPEFDWSSQLVYPFRAGLPGAETVLGVSRVFAAIAETGSLVLVSSPGAATSLNFLPNIHCVVLHSPQIVGTMEEVFARLRQHYPQGLPRTVNFISGASRTSDIEGRLLHGIHGPRHLHILWIGRHAPA
ncbi:MAG: lactate utilization protein [Alphaproteobacteria bacterium]|nr:lactate utilization protein [Alphaproteobacteria bacterium]